MVDIPQDIFTWMADYSGQPIDQLHTAQPHIIAATFEEMATYHICMRFAPGFTKAQARDAMISGAGDMQTFGVAVFINGDYLPNNSKGDEFLENTDIDNVCFVFTQISPGQTLEFPNLERAAGKLAELFAHTEQAREHPRRASRRRQIGRIMDDLITSKRLNVIQTEHYVVSLAGEAGQPANLRKNAETFRLRASKLLQGIVKAEAPPNVEILTLSRCRELFAPAAATASAPLLAPPPASGPVAVPPTPAAEVQPQPAPPRMRPTLVPPPPPTAPQPAVQAEAGVREAVLKGVELSPMPGAGHISMGFIGLVEASEFVKILERPDGMGPIEDLAAYNVRNFLGADEPVNQHIAESVKGPNTDQFAYLNNGVVLVADAAQYKPGQLTLRNYHIVNGLQTSMTLYGLRHELTKKPGCRLILKVAVTPDHEMRREISRSSNRQTAIASLALKTDHFFLRRIAKSFEKRGNADKAFPIRLAVGGESLVDKASVDIMTGDDLIRAVGATFLRRPHAAAKGASRFASDMGRNLFQDAHPDAPYLLAAKIMALVDDHLTSGATEPRYRYQMAYGLLVLAEQDASPKDLSDPTLIEACERIEKRLDSSKVNKALGVVEDAVRRVVKNARKRGDNRDLEDQNKAFTQPLTHSIVHRKSGFRW